MKLEVVRRRLRVHRATTRVRENALDLFLAIFLSFLSSIVKERRGMGGRKKSAKSRVCTRLEIRARYERRKFSRGRGEEWGRERRAVAVVG